MIERTELEQETVDLYPKVYAKGFAFGEKAYNNGQCWGYVSKIGERKDGITPARYAYWRGLHEGWDEAKKISEEYYEPIE